MTIGIIDYGMGNLRSVQKGLEKVDAAAEIIRHPEQILAAKKIVLPGVGAFEDAIAELRRQNLIEPILETIQQGKPFLGICLGLQLLFDTSFENGVHQGLGVLAGVVKRFELSDDFSVPHMGWNQLHKKKETPLLNGIAEGAYVYFVHSYYVVPTDPEVCAAETDYGGTFCAMIARDNLFATQFHPEKSQKVGLNILENFANL